MFSIASNICILISPGIQYQTAMVKLHYGVGNTSFLIHYFSLQDTYIPICRRKIVSNLGFIQEYTSFIYLNIKFIQRCLTFNKNNVGVFVNQSARFNDVIRCDDEETMLELVSEEGHSVF